MTAVALLGLRILFVLGLYAFIFWCVKWIASDVRSAGEQRGFMTEVDSSRRILAKKPRELLVHFNSGNDRKVSLKSGQDVSFGRSANCTVQINDPYVSSHHARIGTSGGDWVIYDLGAANGTFLNDERVTQPTPLRNGDHIRIGSVTVEVKR